MRKITFDKDSYEKDLSLIMLETLAKSNTIGAAIYRAAKKGICEKEVPDECTGNVEGTAEIVV